MKTKMSMFALVLVWFLALLIVNIESASVAPPSVSFSSIKLSQLGGVSSFQIDFDKSVSFLDPRHLTVLDSANEVISLDDATFSPINGGLSWVISKNSSFSQNSNVTVIFVNNPPSLCPNNIPLIDVSNPDTVVGTGTPASCSEDTFTAAIKTGGIITFNCGENPVILTVTDVKNVTLIKDTIIDGQGKVTLSGGGKTRILAIQTTYDQQRPRVTLQNLQFTQGYTTDVTNTKSTSTGGGAIYRLGGAFTIINCDFYNNKGPVTGQDVAGGAIYSVGGSDTTIYNSTFSGNKCSNGGAIGNLGNSFSIYNSVVNGNQATGNSGNPGNGGNGGAISFDGEGVNTEICGTALSYNNAGSFGGAIFRVGYTYSDYIWISNSTFAYNQATSSAGAIYVQQLSVSISNSTVMFNTAPGAAGIALQYEASYNLSGVTVANNTATTSLGGGIYINNGFGTISDSTIVGNVATQAFAAGISGGDLNTTLIRTIIAYSQEGNKYVALSCQTTLADGGQNYQWPQKRNDGNLDNNCTKNVIFEDPQLSNVNDNGCVSFSSISNIGIDSGAKCDSSISPLFIATYENGQIIPRGPFTVNLQNIQNKNKNENNSSNSLSLNVVIYLFCLVIFIMFVLY